MFLIDPLVLTLIVSGGIFGTSFILGFGFGKTEKDRIIEETIKYLCDDGFLKYEDRDGEIEIIRMENENGNGETKEEN